MRQILIVDDEPNLVDGLCQALIESIDEEIDISKAYSGTEALDILSKTPIDLVITDVRMPDIDGLELLNAIHERRLSSRVLILTGYDEFNAIHEAVKLPQTAGFLLKTEGDEEIIKAVKASLTAIDEDEKNQLSLALAKQQSKALDTLLKERKLRHILGLLPYSSESLVSPEITLQIDTDSPIQLVIVRCLSGYINSEALILLEQLTNQRLSDVYNMEMSLLGSRDMVWLLQEKIDNASSPLRSAWIEIQTLLASNNIEVSIALTSKYVEPADLPGYLFAMRNILRNICIGNNHLQVVDVSTDEQEFLASLLESVNSYVDGDKYIHNAKSALLEGDNEAWNSAALAAVKLSNSDPSVITRLLSVLIQANEALRLPAIPDTLTLLSPALDYEKLRLYGTQLCVSRRSFSKSIVADLMARIHKVIEKNLDNPGLSISSIATQLHYNPSYLSRLYKQHSGNTIMEIINDMRINRACALLKDSELKINDIAQKVGYASPSYFTFFFKKKRGMTPKEFRGN